MNANPQKKMCWNCEGNVQLEEEVCPYCRTVLDTEFSHAMHDGGTLYPSFSSPSKIIPANTFAVVSQDEDARGQNESEESSDSLFSMACTMALLMQGIILSIFAAVLLLFSRDGKLILQWNSDYWFLYLCMALPMLYFGTRSLRRPGHSDE